MRLQSRKRLSLRRKTNPPIFLMPGSNRKTPFLTRKESRKKPLSRRRKILTFSGLNRNLSEQSP